MTDDADRIRIHHRRLQAFLAQVQDTRPENSQRPGRPATGVPPLVEPYNALLERTRGLFRDDSVVLEVLDELKPVEDVSGRLHSTYHMEAKQQLVFGLNTMIQALEGRMLSMTGAPVNVSIEREGLYVSGQRFDALLAASRIIATAEVDIVLVDGYINDGVLNLMTGKTETATVRIVTKPPARPNIAALATAFNQQYGAKGPLSIRTSSAFHDRFLVVDDAQFYHFGASLKDLGGRGFMFSRIEEPTVVASLRQGIADEWKRASVIV